MLDLDTRRINSFAIEWVHRIRDEDMRAGVLIISGQYLMYAKWQRRDRDQRYRPQFPHRNRHFFRMIQWKQEDRQHEIEWGFAGTYRRIVAPTNYVPYQHASATVIFPNTVR